MKAYNSKGGIPLVQFNTHSKFIFEVGRIAIAANIINAILHNLPLIYMLAYS